MLIKKQTDDSPIRKKDHTEGRAVYLSTPKDAAAVPGTYSDEILCSPLETYALQVGASNRFLMLCYFGAGVWGV